MAFKSDSKLKVMEFENYTTKDGRVIENIVFGDLEKCLRYSLRIPRGMPKPKVGEMAEISIDLKEYQGRLYPVLSKVE